MVVTGLALLLVCGCVSVDETQVVETSGGTEISPVLEQAQEHHLKRRVAIARFDNQTLYGKSVLLLREADFLALQASDILSSRLAETEKFVLVEYANTPRLIEAVDEGAVGDLGIPADYVIVGSVTEFGRTTTGETGFMTRTKTQTASARVHVRIVDVRTSEVIFGTEGAGAASVEAGTVAGFGTKAGYDSTLNDKAISAAIAKVVGNIAEKLLEQPWRSYVIEVRGDSVLIAGGAGQGIRAGDRFAVLRRGRMVDNPQTGRPIELPREQVATIQVKALFGSNAMQEGARCAVVSGAVPPGDLSQYIVEEVNP